MWALHWLPEILDLLHHMDLSHPERQRVDPTLRRRPTPRPAINGRAGWHPGRQRRRRLPPRAHRTDGSHRLERRLSVGSGLPPLISGQAGCASRSRGRRIWRRTWWNGCKRWPMTGPALCEQSRSELPLLTSRGDAQRLSVAPPARAAHEVHPTCSNGSTKRSSSGPTPCGSFETERVAFDGSVHLPLKRTKTGPIEACPTRK